MPHSEPDWLTTARVLTPKTARQAGLALFLFVALPGLALLWYDETNPIEFFNSACESIESGTPIVDAVERLGAGHWASTCADDCVELEDPAGLPLKAGCDGAICTAVFDDGSRTCTLAFGRSSRVTAGPGELGR
ncbi:MAG: hypothetical protein KDA24_29980 [Deltaproteobacteria bacterium]|nr:hypothetical protein [Deltaproteobacteria bacterium]